MCSGHGSGSLQMAIEVSNISFFTSLLPSSDHMPLLICDIFSVTLDLATWTCELYLDAVICKVTPGSMAGYYTVVLITTRNLRASSTFISGLKKEQKMRRKLA
ncbi:hypothetical protein ACJX0J_026573, partial [Zea mays]